MVASGLVLTIGILVGGNIAMTANLLWLVPLVAVVTLTSIAMAFAIAGFTPNPQTAANVGATITFLMFGFAGVMFPIDALPGVLPDVVPYVVPHASLLEAVRGIALTGDSITVYGQQVLVGVGWLALALAVASLAYRFTEN